MVELDKRNDKTKRPNSLPWLIAWCLIFRHKPPATAGGSDRALPHGRAAAPIRAARLSAFFIDCQNRGELIADVATLPDDVAKAERITPSFAEAMPNSCSTVRASEA